MRWIALAAAAALTAAAAAAQDTGRWGPPRDDLERFLGLYGTPDDPDGRDYFVARAAPPPGADLEIPEGIMMIGAMWGDVAPWYMKSLEDARFLRPGFNEYNPDIVVEFETGPDGAATALRFVEGMQYEEPRGWSASATCPRAGSGLALPFARRTAKVPREPSPAGEPCP